VWLVVLSDQLPVIALVGRYPANKLIGRGLLEKCQALRSPALASSPCGDWPHAVLIRLSTSYPPLLGRLPTCYAPLRHWEHAILLPRTPRSTCMSYPRRQRSFSGAVVRSTFDCLKKPTYNAQFNSCQFRPFREPAAEAAISQNRTLKELLPRRERVNESIRLATAASEFVGSTIKVGCQI